MPHHKKGSGRDWQPREQRLVSEFVAKFYPDYESRTHTHLGSPPPRFKGMFATDAEARLTGVFRRWADALIFLPDRIILIEGKILPQPGVISQLNLYAELIPKTADLGEHKDKEVVKMLVCAIDDVLVSELARREGILVRIFHPAWVDEYLKKVHPYERTPGLNVL